MLEALKKSFLGLRQNRGENPTKAFDYRVAADSAGFQLAGIMGETAVYQSTTTDMDADEILLAVTTYPFPIKRDDTLNFATEWLQKDLKCEVEIATWYKEEGIDMDRLTLIGFTKGIEKPIQAYQVLWLGRNRIHRLLGMCPDHHVALLARLEKFAATFQLL